MTRAAQTHPVEHVLYPQSVLGVRPAEKPLSISVRVGLGYGPVNRRTQINFEAPVKEREGGGREVGNDMLMIL